MELARTVSRADREGCVGEDRLARALEALEALVRAPEQREWGALTAAATRELDAALDDATPTPSGSGSRLLRAHFVQTRRCHQRRFREIAARLADGRDLPMLCRAAICGLVVALRDDLERERTYGSA
jgi:hypothetical protein